MRNGRAYKLLGGLGFGYLQTFSTILVGLWLTPYLLRQLGSHDYGLWILGAQVVFYLGLLDLGVVALVPREVASASGLPESDRVESVQTLVGRTTRLVLWQLPLVALTGGAVLWLLPAEWEQLRGPLGLVLLVFVLTFPCRVIVAVLQGLQDLAFVGSIQLASWVAGTVSTVVCIVAGMGLYSLTLGWVVTQAVSATMAWIRLTRAFPEVVPRRLPSLTLAAVREQIGRGMWVSLGQVAQVLLSGTDLVVVGKLLGPEAVVPYACTGKLVTLLANQPQMFMQLALPALSELRTSAPRSRLFEVSRSMTQVMLLGSGAIVAVVLASNAAFVAWWVGNTQFGGLGLTALLLAGMLVRHLNVTASYALFCFGNERRLAVTAIADGVVGVTAMMILVPVIGLHGAALGPFLATCLVSLPNNLRALAREEGSSPTTLLAPLRSWLARLALLLAAIAALMSVVSVHGVLALAGVGLAVTATYLVVMLPVMRKPPLGSLLATAIRPCVLRLEALVGRRSGQPVSLNW